MEGDHESESKHNIATMGLEDPLRQSYFMSIFQKYREYFEYGGTIMGLTSAPSHYESSVQLF